MEVNKNCFQREDNNKSQNKNYFRLKRIRKRRRRIYGKENNKKICNHRTRIKKIIFKDNLVAVAVAVVVVDHKVDRAII